MGQSGSSALKQRWDEAIGRVIRVRISFNSMHGAGEPRLGEAGGALGSGCSAGDCGSGDELGG